MLTTAADPADGPGPTFPATLRRRRNPAVWVALICVVLAVFATRWPFRSRALFSWDSANYALALDHIDIAKHQPHPPGYLGYVLAARGLNTVIGDANTALVAWNLIATTLSVIVIGLFAWESTATERNRAMAAIGAMAIVLTSPSLWFYDEVAEVYPSETLVSLLVAYSAWRAIRGGGRAIYWCMVALALAAVFKLTAAILMFPVAGYAWLCQPPARRRRSAAVLIVVTAVVLAAFIAVQHNFFTINWNHFVSSTSRSRLIGNQTPNPLKTLNLGVRDTLIGAAAALGLVNTVGLIAWALFSRSLPPRLGPRYLALWGAPWLIVFTVIHIGKVGYVLPLLPLAALVLAGFYACQRRAVAVALIAVQALFNTWQFAGLRPFSAAAVGSTQLYRSKTLLQRAASDLQALTFPTAFTIADSDARVAQLLTVVGATCESGTPTVIAGTESVDWRRVLYYLPAATSIRVMDDGTPASVARHRDSEPLPVDGLTIHTDCPVIWIAPDDGSRQLRRPTGDSTSIPGLGWTTPPGTIRVAGSGITR